MSEITWFQCVVGAWRDGLRTIMLRPLSFVGVFVVTVIIGFVQYKLQVTLATAKANGDAVAILRQAPMGLLPLLVQLWVMGFAVVLASRHVVLGAESLALLYDTRSIMQFVWLAFQLGILFVVAAVVIFFGSRLILHSRSPFLPLLLGIVFTCLAAWVHTRVSLLFVHVALGRPKRWGDCWRDTSGHFWTIFGTSVAITATTAVVATLGYAIVRVAMRLAQADPTNVAFASIVEQAAVTAVLLPVGSAGMAWIYLRFANRLAGNSDAQPPSRSDIDFSMSS